VMPRRNGFASARRLTEHGFVAARRSAEHGFTLVEVMVALMIFGMLAAAGVAVLSFSVRAQAATTARFDDLAGLERTGAIMAADLGQALARPTRDEVGTLLPALVGDATTLRLVRGGWTNIDGAARPGAQKLLYRFDGGRWQRVAYPQLDGAAALDPAALIDRMQAVRLRYRFRGAWTDRWDGAGGIPLPDAVELTLIRRGGLAYRQLFLVGTGYTGTAVIADATG
jgi:general secretion pathway protein J